MSDETGGGSLPLRLDLDSIQTNDARAVIDHLAHYPAPR